MQPAGKASRPCTLPLAVTSAHDHARYDGSERLWKVHDAKGRVALTLEYDPVSGLLDEVQITLDPANPVIHGYDDDLAQLSAYTDPQLAETIATWSDPVEPAPTPWSYAYSGPDGRMSKTIDPEGREMVNHYDARHRVFAQEDEAGRVFHLAFDDDGEQAVQVSPGGRVHLVGFDSGGRFTESIDPAGNTRGLSWSDNNEKESAIDARGIKREWTIDPATGQPTEERLTVGSDPPEVQWRQTYEPEYGRVATRTERVAEGDIDTDTGNVATLTTYEYLGLTTTTMVDPADLGGPAVPAYEASSTEAKATGQVDLMTGIDDGVTAPQQTDYEYDLATGSLASVARAIEASATPGNPAGWSTTTITSDAQGRMETMTPPTGDPMTLGYDGSGRMASMEGGSSGDLTINYTPVGWQQELVSTRNGTTTFAHDALGRVTRQSSPNGVVETGYNAAGQVAWTKDARGNVTRSEYDELGRVSRRINADGTEFSFDYCSDLGCASCGSASACAVIGPDGQVVLSREHDERGRVTKVTDAGGISVEMDYDSEGRLWKRRWQQSLHADPEQPVPAAGNAEQTLEIEFKYLWPCQLPSA